MSASLAYIRHKCACFGNHVCVLACPPLPLSGGAGDHLQSPQRMQRMHEPQDYLAAHEDLRETFSKTLRYRITNLSLQVQLEQREECRNYN